MRTILLLILILILIFPFSSKAADNNTDPNAAIRKSMDPLGTTSAVSAVEDIQRVQKRNNELAVEHFTRMIEKNAKDAPSYARSGKAYSGLKDYDKALEDVEKAIELDAQLAEAYMTRAVVHFVKNDYPASWEDVHKVESTGGQMWPSFMDALKEKSGRTE